MPVVGPASEHHLDAIGQLWQEVGLRSLPSLRAGHLRTAVSRHPQLVLVAGPAQAPVGAVLGTFDGLRGWIYGLAVAPASRRQGVARALITNLEQRYHELGVWLVGGLGPRDDARTLALADALAYTEVRPRAVYHGSGLEPIPMPEVPGLHLRRAEPHDLGAVLDLWARSDIGRDVDVLGREFEDRLRHDPGLFLVAERADRIVGATMGGFDGVQGWIYRMAVSSAARRLRVAVALNSALGEAFASRGATWRGGLVLERNEMGMGYAVARGGVTWSGWVYLRKRLAPPAGGRASSR